MDDKQYTADDLYDMFANQASAEDIAAMSIEQIAADLAVVMNGTDNTTGMTVEEIATSIHTHAQQLVRSKAAAMLGSMTSERKAVAVRKNGRKGGRDKARFYIRLDTYWENSPDRWFGPYTTRQEAEQAAAESGAARADLGQNGNDVRYQTRILGIYNATDSKHIGRKDTNTFDSGVPGNTTELFRIEEQYSIQ